MRIVRGKYKGHRVNSKIPPAIRPTADSVRETIFNILNNYIDMEDIVCADVCAGTGFLGFEALSRGAEHCFFFEKNRKSAEMIRKNAEIIRIPKNDFTLSFGDAHKTLKRFSENAPDKQFDLIFFDPPYASMISNSIIDVITSINLLNPNGILIAEHSEKESILLPENYELLKSRKFGDTIVDFIVVK